MKTLEVGDKVRIDIPDHEDPDHQYHRKTGTITEIQEDDAAATTGDPRDQYIYTVQTQGKTVDFRWRDLRPIPDQP